MAEQHEHLECSHCDCVSHEWMNYPYLIQVALIGSLLLEKQSQNVRYGDLAKIRLVDRIKQSKTHLVLVFVGHYA